MWKAVQLLAVVGVVLALYLLWEQATRAPFSVCNINSFVNCNAIISGPVATTFGISTPLIGLVGYVGMLLAAIYKKKKTLLGFVSFGLLFCLWIAYQEFFLLHVLCPVCILCQLDMLSVFILALFLQKQRKLH